jgi:cellulose synthase (UDP-forming)
MITSGYSKKLKSSFSWGIRRSQIPSLFILGTVGFASAIACGWLTGERRITSFFAHLNFWQENPPWWIEVPAIPHQFLLVPTAILFSIALITIKLSPKPKKGTRAIVVGILLALTIRYLLWRSLSTLNLDNPVNGIFSIGLFLMEMLILSSSIIQLFLSIEIKERPKEANQKQKSAIANNFTPAVDILIPTYNEPEFILRRTVIGCQAIDYPQKKVYLLDDSSRPHIEKLAGELGCEYIKRSDNRHAKAGNLNNAIAQTCGELIVVFDADFIPTTNFLKRTIGFFQNAKIGLVQTPQNFYNQDPIARNLGLENILTSEEEAFYRQIEPIKDSAGSVLCAGTSFIVRRSALQEVGGFVTDSLCEDYFTGIRLSAKGYELVYLNEKLSAGLAAENIADHINQRLRWVRGTLQAFFIDSNPLTIPGLKLRQRLAHLEGLLHWFNSIPRLLLLLMPLAYSWLGIEFIEVTFPELIYFFLPYYLLNLTVFSWLNYRSRSAFLSDIYSLVSCVPLAFTASKFMLNPSYSGFKVTPKGLSRDKFDFNWNLAWPLIMLLIANAASFGKSLEITYSLQTSNLNLVLMWSAYNIFTISIAILTLMDVPKPDIYEWFSLQREVKLICGSDNYCQAIATKISEVGAEIKVKDWNNLSDKIFLYFWEDDLQITGKIVKTTNNGDFCNLLVRFEDVTLELQRKLVKMLFCSPGRWESKNSPGEWESIWLLLKVLLLKPRALLKNARG